MALIPKICQCYCGLPFATAEGLNAHMVAMRVLPHARPVTGQTPPLIVEGLPQGRKSPRRPLSDVLVP